MPMMILKEELKKLCLFVPLWIFLSFCLVLNTAVAFLSEKSYEIDYISSVTAKTGNVYGEDYTARLAKISPPENNSPYSQLFNDIKDAADFENTYANFELSEKNAEIMAGIKSKSITKAAGLLLQLKNFLYSPTAKRLAQTDRSQSVYFSNVTTEIHQAVFGTMLHLFAFESLIACVLMTLLSFGFEDLMQTSSVVLSTACGRQVFGKKLAVSLVGSCVFFVLVFGTGYATVFSLNDFSGVWNFPVDSCNNLWRTSDGFGQMLLWKEMTVGEYFFAVVFLTLAIMLVVGLFTAAVYCFSVRLVPSAIVVFGLSVANIAVIISGKPAKIGILRFLLHMTPVATLFENGTWFTLGDEVTLLPWNEIISVLFFAVFVFFLLCLARRRLIMSDVQ